MSVLKNSYSAIFFNLIKVVISFLINILLAKSLKSPDTFGLLLFVLSLIDLLIVVLGIGIQGAIVRYAKQNYEINSLSNYINEITSYVYTLYFVFISIILIFNSFFSDLLFGIYDIKLIMLLVVLLPLRALNRLYSSIFWGFNNFLKRGLNEMFASLFQLIFLLFIYFLLLNNIHLIWFLISSYFLSEIISIIYFNRVLINEYQISLLRYNLPNFRFSKIFKKNLKFGAWTMLAAINLTLMNIVDKASINKFISSEMLGKYSIIILISGYFLLPVRMISNVVLTNFIDDWEKDKQNVIKKINNIYFRTSICLFFILILFNHFLPDFIKLFFGSNYQGLEYLFPVLIIAIMIKVHYMVFGNLAAISENPYITTISFIPGLIVNIIGNIIFVPIYGVLAAIITTVISYIFIVILLYILLYKENIYLGFKSIILSIFFVLSIYIIYMRNI